MSPFVTIKKMVMEGIFYVKYPCDQEEEIMSKELAKTYDPKGLEDRIYQKWLDNKYFHAEVNPDKKPFTIVMPPPNVTGQLHMGHALDETMQDILIRFKRMEGYEALWQPGTDHAAIATEVKVTEKLKEQGIRVTAVCPGPVKTEFLKKAYGNQKISGYKRLVMADCDHVVSCAVKDAKKGKAVSVYGMTMKLTRWICRIFPEELIVRFFQS